ncbi:hypothetical protein GDO81_029204 [Engystomops pustulosus]|uniref:Uncharacterized protein n=1 Tax=Engystomops pustulosus TaxID=76066 RepID=A0AAV6Z214_ENGPU|nr:hypothetical protein GDO81_029204 [Engystomops pustulosus]
MSLAWNPLRSGREDAMTAVAGGSGLLSIAGNVASCSSSNLRAAPSAALLQYKTPAVIYFLPSFLQPLPGQPSSGKRTRVPVTTTLHPNTEPAAEAGQQACNPWRRPYNAARIYGRELWRWSIICTSFLSEFALETMCKLVVHVCEGRPPVG